MEAELEFLKITGFDMKKINRAKKAVESMDKEDGFSQVDLGLATALRTVVLALYSGIRCKAKPSFYEGIIMLMQIHYKLNT